MTFDEPAPSQLLLNDTKTLSLPWTIFSQINIRSDNATTITTHDLHGNPSAAFQAPSDIIPIPSEAKRNLRVDA